MSQFRAKPKADVLTGRAKRKLPSQPVAPPADFATRITAVARLFATLDSWIAAHAEVLAWLVALIGLYLRVHRAGLTYFNSDEAQIMIPPLQHGWLNVCRSGMAYPHGPLMNLVLHVMTWFGSSDAYFRMASVVTGALIPPVAYRWAAGIFGKTAGLVTASILSFSPALIILSAQVRFYMPQMFLMVCSLYGLERAFQVKSPRWMRLFGATLLLALLTEYMTIWYAVPIGIYALIRIAKRELPRRIVVEWAAIQAMAACLVIIAYFAHLRRFAGNAGETFARESWLRPSYFHSTDQSVLGFVGSATSSLFAYLFANSSVGIYMIAVFVIGVGLILARRARVPQLSALFLVLPLVATTAGGLFGVYPYGGTRHDAFLAVFVAPAVGVAVAFLARERVTILVLAAIFIVPLWLGAEQHHYLDEFVQFSQPAQMREALDYLATRSPKPRVLVLDHISMSFAQYYVCHGQIVDLFLDDYIGSCGDYMLLRVAKWGASLPEAAEWLAQARHSRPNLLPDPAWAFLVAASPTPDMSEIDVDHGMFGKMTLARLSPDPASQP